MIQNKKPVLFVHSVGVQLCRGCDHLTSGSCRCRRHSHNAEGLLQPHAAVPCRLGSWSSGWGCFTPPPASCKQLSDWII